MWLGGAGTFSFTDVYAFAPAPTVPGTQEKAQLGVCTRAKAVSSQTLLLLAASYRGNVGVRMLARCWEQWPRQCAGAACAERCGSRCLIRKAQAEGGAPPAAVPVVTASRGWVASTIPTQPSLGQPALPGSGPHPSRRRHQHEQS